MTALENINRLGAALAAGAYEGTKALHYASGTALAWGIGITVMSATALPLLAAVSLSLAYLGGFVTLAQLTALKAPILFVASKWALGMAGITGLFYLTHLPLFGRYLYTVRKLQAIIEKATGKQLEVRYERLAAQLSGGRFFLLGAVTTKPLGHLSYQGLHFSLHTPGELFTEDACGDDGHCEHITVERPESHPLKEFTAPVAKLAEDEEFVRLYEIAKECVGILG